MAINDELRAQILRYHFVERWREGTIASLLSVHHYTVERVLSEAGVERDQLRPLPELLYDVGAVHTVRASNRFRVTKQARAASGTFDTNRYSVPAEYASQRLTLKSYPDRLCIYHHDRLLARHRRSYERHRDFEHPDHPRALLEQRRKATTQRLLQRFISLPVL